MKAQPPVLLQMYVSEPCAPCFASRAGRLLGRITLDAGLPSAGWPCAVQVQPAAIALMQSCDTHLLAQVLQAATALALSATICHIGVESARACGVTGGGIPFITVITVLLATAAPKALTPLVPTAEGLAAILMQVGPCVRSVAACANLLKDPHFLSLQACMLLARDTAELCSFACVGR